MKIDLAPFKDLIRQRCGLTLEGNNAEKLASALERRILASVSGDPASYFSCLRDCDSEFQTLVNLLTINETYFFRESEQLNLLAERMAPRLLARENGGVPLRILSAGCASGEEPYSIAMALREKYGENVARLFSVVGGDINTQVLHKARAGRFSEFSFRGVPAAIKSRYFDRERCGYSLKAEVRDMVEFHELNLLAPSFPDALRGFDIIFFRNVSIYFDKPMRRLIQQNLVSLLKEDGYLVVGTAETLANDLNVLPMIEEDGLFYFAKGKLSGAPCALPRFEFPGAAPEESPVLSSWKSAYLTEIQNIAAPCEVPVSADSVPCPAAMPPDSVWVDDDGIDQAQRLIREKRHDDALAITTRLLAQNADDITALLLQAHIQFNRREFGLAEACARLVLETDSWSIDALILLGLCAKWRDQIDAAVDWFKKAVYARHECWPAHYYLGDLYRSGGQIDKAQREYRVVRQLLSAQAAPDLGIKILQLGLPVAEVRFLCEHHLGKLDRRSSDQRIALRK